MRRIELFVFLLSLSWISLFSEQIQAYPNFIGYGYATCAVCHFNSQGNGPLTDYGRALFAQEIASRALIPKRISDEVLAENSGFIPGATLPYWLRPSIKYRGLWLNTEPQSAREKQRYIEMQRDVNLVVAFDEEARTIASVTYGLLPQPKKYYDGQETNSAISREHYLRFYLGEKFLVSMGLMDKVYGLRIGDHTAVSRSQIGFGQDDQVHGIYLEYSDDNWLWGVHLFQGNLLKSAPDRQKGASSIFEYEIFERNRAGFSVASFENDYSRFTRLAIHDKWGFANLQGSSLLFEVGLKDDRKKTDSQQRLGVYSLVEATMLLTRGYSLVSTIERIQHEIKMSAADQQRWSFGVLMFPFQRVEVRLATVFTKGFSTESAVEDRQAIQGQIHVSL